MKRVSFTYIPSDVRTRFLEIQVWHGHETTHPLPNIVWIDDVEVYDITRYTKPVTLEIPFTVEDSGDYKLFIRYFKNQKGGLIKVYLDGESISIETRDQLNKFVWEDLGTFYLEKGEYKIVLENVYGFNAVNLFALIPEDEYYRALDEVSQLLLDKTVIYLFEAESDLYRLNAEIIKDINFSNGEALSLDNNSIVWQNLDIVKGGSYRLAIRGIGSFKVVIGDYIFILESDTLNFTYSPLFYLEEGSYKIEITTLNGEGKLDTLWLYSTETDKTVEQLFEVKVKPAEVVSFEKVDPTLWRVEVDAKKPFMLSFAEAYDPLWEARIYKDGELIDKVKSIPLYSVINGFWIDETGRLTIEIRYLPQDWFELGIIISASTFTLSIFYLVWDWRRDRGDLWALKLESIFRRMVRKALNLPKTILKLFHNHF